MAHMTSSAKFAQACADRLVPMSSFGNWRFTAILGAVAVLGLAMTAALGGLAVAAIHHELAVSSAVIRRLELSSK